MDELILISPSKLESILRKIVQEEIIQVIPQRINTSNDSTELLTFKQTQLLLKISRPTLFKRMKDGTIPFKRVGRRLLFSKNEILNRLEISNVGKNGK